MNRRRVLIETSWNVKFQEANSLFYFRSCINRNIVECKDNYEIFEDAGYSVLIETSWNVKQHPWQFVQ